MKSNEKKKTYDYVLPDYITIELAVRGDVDAINAILHYYERYITALSTRTLYDEGGMPNLCIDEEKKRRLETKLITKILSFKFLPESGT